MKSARVRAGLVALLTLSPTSGWAQEDVTWDLLLDGGIAGRFVRPYCRADRQKNLHQTVYPRRVAFGRQLRANAVARGAWEPLFLNTGDLIYPNATSRFLLQHKEQGRATLVQLLDGYGYDSIGVGNHEFGGLTSTMGPYWEAARAERVPFNAGNLTCKASAKALCALLRTQGTAPPYRIVARGGARVAILGLTDPALRDVIAKSHEEGVVFGAMEEALKRWVPKMRAKADVVIVHAHVANAAKLTALEQTITAIPGIDVLVANTPHDDAMAKERESAESPGYRVLDRTGTLSLRSGRDEEETTIATLRMRRGPKGWRASVSRVRSHTFSRGALDASAKALIKGLHRDYCAAWGVAIGEKASFAKPWTASRFENEVLEILRQRSGAEISMLNKGAFRDRDQFPLTKHLTLSDLYSSLPFSTQVVIAELQGSHIAKLAGALKKGNLLALGLTVDKKGVKVNGRPVDTKRWYRVALNQYVAQGGDGFLQESWLRGVRMEPGVLDTWLLEQWRRRGLATPVNLHERFLWSIRTEINVSYKQVDVTNPLQADGETAAYTQPQLTVNPTSQVNLDGKLAVGANRKDHVLDAELQLQFATARVDDGDPETVETFEETADRIQLKSSYAFSGGGSSWWRPMPFLEGQLQSEFTAPEERTFHRFELTGILGARFQVLPTLGLKAGVNVRNEVFDASTPASFGLNLGYMLAKTDVVTWRTNALKVESNLEYFFNDIGGQNLQEIRNQNRAFWTITDQLALTLTFNVYGFRSEAIGAWGRNTELMLGLLHHLGGSFQTGR